MLCQEGATQCDLRILDYGKGCQGGRERESAEIQAHMGYNKTEGNPSNDDDDYD